MVKVKESAYPLQEFCFDGFYDCRLFGLISVFRMHATCNMSILHNCGNMHIFLSLTLLVLQTCHCISCAIAGD